MSEDAPLRTIFFPYRGQRSGPLDEYKYSEHSDWRWTHAFVENAAAAVVLAATNPFAGCRVYNVGEAYTSTIQERLAWVPQSTVEPNVNSDFDFTQNIACDTTRTHGISPGELSLKKTSLPRTPEGKAA